MIPPSRVLCSLRRPQLLTDLSGLPAGKVALCSTSCLLHTHHAQRAALGTSCGGETLGGRPWTAGTELMGLPPKQERDKPSGVMGFGGLI
jgi:hypothetical protein